MPIRTETDNGIAIKPESTPDFDAFVNFMSTAAEMLEERQAQGAHGRMGTPSEVTEAKIIKAHFVKGEKPE